MTVSTELTRLAGVCAQPPVTFRTLVAPMTAREHAVLTLFLGVCFMHPVPMPGLSFILGVIISIAGARIARGLGPWVPERWLDRELPGGVLAQVLEKAAALARRVEPKSARPSAWMDGAAIRLVVGASISICGVLICTPFPPPTNFPPAIALILLSVATILQRPGWLAAGLIALAANLCLFGALTAGAAVAALAVLR
ncbi:MAG: exopolysaccharide biosynthesis protein [Elusimicrobia bacterium]|nr:exopolysaccharide biosynthesis protein [Elusimicrobiota bacterium]